MKYTRIFPEGITYNDYKAVRTAEPTKTVKYTRLLPEGMTLSPGDISPAKSDMSSLGAFLVGAEEGATAGFGAKARAMTSAGDPYVREAASLRRQAEALPKDDERRQELLAKANYLDSTQEKWIRKYNVPEKVVDFLMGLGKYWGGDEEAEQAYDKALAERRMMEERAGAEHPFSYTGGQIAGTVGSLLPFGVVGGASRAGTSLLGRAGQTLAGVPIKEGYKGAALAGAGRGALEAAGHTDRYGDLGTEDLIRGAASSGIGAAGGALGHALAQPIGALARGVAEKTSRLRGGKPAEASAFREFVGKTTPGQREEFKRALQEEGALPLAVAPEGWRNVLVKEAQANPKLHDLLTSKLAPYETEAGSRTLSAWDKVLGTPVDTQLLKEDISKAAVKATQAKYAKTDKIAYPQSKLAELDKIFSSSYGRTAQRIAKENIALQGGKVKPLPEKLREKYPNITYWPTVQSIREVGNYLGSKAPLERGANKQALAKLAERLKSYNAQVSPEHAKVSAEYKGLKSLEKAIQAGEEKGLKTKDLIARTRDWSGTPAAERELEKKGLRKWLEGEFNVATDIPKSGANILSQKGSRDTLRAIVGEEPLKKLMQSQENIIRNRELARSIPSYSGIPTEQYQFNLGDIGKYGILRQAYNLIPNAFKSFDVKSRQNAEALIGKAFLGDVPSKQLLDSIVRAEEQYKNGLLSERVFKGIVENIVRQASAKSASKIGG